MKFSMWLENNNQIQIPVAKLYGETSKIQQTIADIQAKRLSQSVGEPITVSKLDNPRGSFFVLNGYHRVIEAILAGHPSIIGSIDIHIPRIERTGGGYNSWVNTKMRIIDAVKSTL